MICELLSFGPRFGLFRRAGLGLEFGTNWAQASMTVGFYKPGQRNAQALRYRPKRPGRKQASPGKKKEREIKREPE